MRLGKTPKFTLPDFKSSPKAPKTNKPDITPKPSPRPDINGNIPGKKPDTTPKFSPRPDINGNIPGKKPDTTPKFSPRPDINGNIPGKKPDFNLDGFSPGNGLNNLKPNRFGSLGNGLSAVGDVVGGVASGAMGLAGAGLEAASMLPGALGMMDPFAAGVLPPELAGGPMMDPYATAGLPPELAGGPMMDPYAAGGPMMDPYATAGLPSQLAAGPMMDPTMDPTALQQSDLGNILNSVAHAISTATQALETVKGLVGENTATVAQPLLKMAAEKLPVARELTAPLTRLQDSQGIDVV
ncbi:PspC family transcriptional regulator [Archangium lipolyticum]|uniref:PspC family transcriptional regulator n=1 Tax=Archangium lipolyticum TaxID=2970465 RepID=UPI00214A2F74|nr:PspC family transcriptional regulator [Archangium lipolyticum]